MTETTIRTLLVIPVYNHGATLKDTVNRALATGLEVLVVDDGSTDQGLAAVKDLPCRTQRLEPNQGKGAAIMAAAETAVELGYDAILTVDADGQHDPAAAVTLLEAVQEEWPVLVLGNRIMEKDSVPRSSLFGRSFSNFWVRLETGLSLPDTQTGMRLYPVRELRNLSFGTSRYDFEIESLVRLSWAGVPIRSVSVPVHYPDEDKRISHFDRFRDNVRLTLLHTRLVSRALVPLPHRRLVKKKEPDQDLSLFLHPVRLFRQLLKEHATPTQLAAAAWVGIFLGAVPLIGMHTVAIIYVCHRLYLNKMAAVAASQLCMPPVVPIICIQTGYYLRHGAFLFELSRETLVDQIWERLWEYLLGSLVVGPLLGLVAAAVVYAAVRYYRGQKNSRRIGHASAD